MLLEVGMWLGNPQHSHFLVAFRFEVAELTLVFLGTLYFPLLFMVFLPNHICPYVSALLRLVLLCWFTVTLPLYLLYQL